MAEAHQWVKWKSIPWLVCKRCGLVWLKNLATSLAVRKGCDCE